METRTQVEFPPGYTVRPPVPITTKGEGLDYRSDYRVEGTRLVVERDLRSTVREIPSAKFGAYSAFVGAVDADLAQRVKVSGAVTATPAVPGDAVALDVYSAALSAYKAKRYDAAVALWKRTAELDPKMGDAWVSLGLAYENLGKYDEASAAIQKQIDLDPFNKRAHSDLGFVLKKAHKPEAAAKAYAKHVELNPLDGKALGQLGELEFELERYTEAAAALDKASSLVKDDGWQLAVLGAAYLQLHQPDKATRAFDRALDAEASPRVWTKVAWVLADAGADLDRAADLATRAIKRVSEEMQDVTLTAVRGRHMDLIERLAWAWDALGWVRFQQGKVAEAERYVHAAWLLDGSGEMAYHVGRVYEQQDRRAEARNFYVTAQAAESKPTGAMVARAKALAGDELATALERTPRVMRLYRMVKLESTAAPGRAEFLVAIKADRRATDVRFVDGDEALRKLEGALKQVIYPVEFPDALSARLVLGVKVACTADECFASVVEPGSVKTEPSAPKQ
jgi:tetratricopeptide (TPR) repeat protein